MHTHHVLRTVQLPNAYLRASWLAVVIIVVNDDTKNEKKITPAPKNPNATHRSSVVRGAMSPYPVLDTVVSAKKTAASHCTGAGASLRS